MSLTHELKHFAESFSILVVEDEKVLNDELSEILSIFFKSVYSAYNGEIGLELYKKYEPDLILTDITMPIMDGIKMSQEIKNIKREQSIVVLSAHSEVSFMIDLIDIGISQFILKPFDKSTLFYRLLKVCENLEYEREFKKFYQTYKEKHDRRRENTLSNISKNSNRVMDKSTNENLVINKQDSLVKIEDNSNSGSNKYNLSHEVANANKFMSDLEDDELLWMAFKDDVTELMEISKDLTDYIDKFTLLLNLTEELRSGIVESICSYVKIFSSLSEMAKMSSSLDDLAEFLNELELNTLTDEQQKRLRLLEFINNDITKFLNTVFVYRDNVDIYYLEDSLESSITQLKSEVTGIEMEEEELELF